MPTRRFLIIGLSTLLFMALSGSGPAASASRSKGSRRSTRQRIQRDHHRGRSFSERRSRRRNPSYFQRDERRRALSERTDERSSPRLNSPGSPGQMPCRTMTLVEEIEGRQALISQRECIDASGLTRVSPGSRRVIRFYDQ